MKNPSSLQHSTTNALRTSSTTHDKRISIQKLYQNNAQSSRNEDIVRSLTSISQRGPPPITNGLSTDR